MPDSPVPKGNSYSGEVGAFAAQDVVRNPLAAMGLELSHHDERQTGVRVGDKLDQFAVQVGRPGCEYDLYQIRS